jgi:tetratricopeptide (TPR) repeat protein
MKWISLCTIFCLLSSAAIADELDRCRDDDLSAEARITACELAVAQAADRTEALVALGDALIDLDRHPEAIVLLSEALALDPDHIFALERRSVAFNFSDRHADALLDLEHLIALDQTQDWYFYRVGVSKNRLGDPAGAQLALETAIALDPDYYWSRSELGSTFRRLGRRAEAGDAYAQAARIRPLSAGPHGAAFLEYDVAGIPDLAAFHARIAHTLNPNQLSMRDWLLAYLGERTPPLLAPMPWAAPSADREIRYLQVLAPVDAREETQQAIEELINFFGGESYPRPDTAMVYRLSFSGDDPERLLPHRTLEHESRESPPMPPPQGVFRGLFQIDVQPLGPDTPVIRPIWSDGNSPADVWPLEAGNQASGRAVLQITCADGGGIPAFMMGCAFEVETVDLGYMDWSIEITTETIQVPMGLFETYRVSFSLEGEITILAKTNALAYDASYWVDPGLNTWVASIFTIGDHYAFSQAMEIVAPAQ